MTMQFPSALVRKPAIDPARVRAIAGLLERVRLTPEARDLLSDFAQGKSEQDVLTERRLSVKALQTDVLFTVFRDTGQLVPSPERAQLLGAAYRILPKIAPVPLAVNEKGEETRHRVLVELMTGLSKFRQGLLRDLREGKELPQMAAERNLLVKDLSGHVTALYDHLGCSKPPTAKEKKLVLDAFTQLYPVRAAPKSASEVTPPRPLQVAAVEPAAPKAQVLTPPPKSISTLAERVHSLSPKDRKLLPHLAAGLRGKSLHAVSLYGTQASTEVAASKIRKILGATKDMSPEQRTALAKEAHALLSA